jgi:long-chain fatty acid transport protein
MSRAARATAAARAAAACAAVALLAPAGARAAGFSLYEQGARALGMAGATTARTDDPSAMFFNPAGLARIEGHHLLVSPNLIFYRVEFSGVAPSPGFGVEEETESKVFPPFAAYYAQSFGTKVAAGVGVFSPYGLEVDWAEPDDFTGRFISTRSKVTPFYVTPTLSAAPSADLRVGVGASIAFSTVELERHLAAYNPFDDRADDIGTVRLDSETGTGVGVNAGAQWWPGRWRFGATWRGKVAIDYAGDADFEQRPTGNPTFDAVVAASFPPDQRVETAIEFPAQASIGVGYQCSDAWSVEGDLNWTDWSTFDRLDIRFDRTPSRNVSIEERWKDVLHVRVGAEYRKGGVSPWSWRAGYYFDASPQPAEGVGPLLPDADRHGVSVGSGYRRGRTSVDAYALYLIVPDRSTEGVNRDGYDGTYSLGTLLVGASLGWAF